MPTSRRQFLCRSVALTATAAFPLDLFAEERSAPAKVRIALIADVHQDVMHDAPQRLQTFLSRANQWQADAVLELGDFCTPKSANRAFADLFQSFPGKKFHVLGNHDTDGGFKREQVTAFHRMPGRYYSFDLGGIHGVVLDANDVPPVHGGGYPSFINDEQVEWLRHDLSGTELPVFVFSHQSLERPTCIRSQDKVRAVLEEAKRKDGTRKVAACLNGHWHIDHWRGINEIPYLHINSASYYWVGAEFRRERYEAAIHQAHPSLSSTAPYRDPLFTLLEVDFSRRAFSLTAAHSAWVGPSPQEMGLKRPEVEPAWITPNCSAREAGLPPPPP
jgi:3',5'-cyclic-AMP phosphodiesterase